MDYCQFAREVMFWNLYFCNSLNRKRPMVISTTIKEGNFISSTSVDFLCITVFLLMFKLFHVALKIVTALTHYFSLFFNLLTGRNYDFDFTHMPHFVIIFAILFYSVYVAFLWSLVPVPLSQSTSVPTGGRVSWTPGISLLHCDPSPFLSSTECLIFLWLLTYRHKTCFNKF